MSLPALPLTLESALATVRFMEDGYNGCDPASLLPLYAIDCQWRVRAEFVWGRDQIRNFLARKWRRELEYRAVGDLWAFHENRLSICFVYEYRDDSGSWFRAYGNDNLSFLPSGLIGQRTVSVNEHPIERFDRRLIWPLGPKPADYGSAIDLGFGPLATP
jgi:nuclear transport factor 2 (NTF2) superfamily protein